jgi:hypothetical protein
MLCSAMVDTEAARTNAGLGMGALHAVAARCRSNRRRLIASGICTLVLAGLALVGVLAPEDARGDWLSFVTFPAALLLLWVGGRFVVFLLRHLALRRDRDDIERLAGAPHARDSA